MHVHVTDDPSKIREIKARYFEAGNEFHLVPILEYPEEEFEKIGWDDVCFQILKSGNRVVICSQEFAELLRSVEIWVADFEFARKCVTEGTARAEADYKSLAEATKRGAEAGENLRNEFMKVGVNRQEFAEGLKHLARVGLLIEKNRIREGVH